MNLNFFACIMSGLLNFCKFSRFFGIMSGIFGDFNAACGVNCGNSFGRHADYKRIIGEMLIFRNKRTGAHKAVFADNRAVHNRCIHSYKTAAAYGAAVKHGVVTDGNIIADNGGKSRCAMHCAIILNI